MTPNFLTKSIKCSSSALHQSVLLTLVLVIALMTNLKTLERSTSKAKPTRNVVQVTRVADVSNHLNQPQVVSINVQLRRNYHILLMHFKTVHCQVTEGDAFTVVFKKRY